MKGSLNEPRRYALRLLKYRSRSEKEIIQRLKRKGFNDSQINSTLEFLKQSGLINDRILVAELLRHAAEKKQLGKKGIQAFLYSRGIEKDIISDTLSELTDDKERETALRFVEKKLKILKNYPANVIKRRLWGMLERRGFSAGVIHWAIRSIPCDEL